MLKRIAAVGLAGLLVAACVEQPAELRVVAGSEVRVLEPMIQEFARRENIQIRMSYLGSVDLMNDLRDKGRDIEADAVWPAHSLWLEMGDASKAVSQATSIMRTPIVFGVRQGRARDLGWDKGDVRVADIAQTVREKGLKLIQTSCTQSNSGAQACLSYFHAAAGAQGALTLEDLAKPEVQAEVKSLLSGIERGSSSSAFLNDLWIGNPRSFDAMVNYEALVIDANRKLSEAGQETMCAVYPRDSLAVADHPLGFVDRPGSPGNDRRKAAFEKFRDWLLSEAAQRSIHGFGWRTSKIGLAQPDADADVFRKSWCIDTARTISPIRMPTSEVVREALALYQGGGLRKPSESAVLLDFSGSMGGAGIKALREGLTLLLDPDNWSRTLLQPGPDDVLHMIPFTEKVGKVITIRGNDKAAYRAALATLLQIPADGGTDFYLALEEANRLLAGAREQGRLPLIMLMTDGESSVGSRERALAPLRRTGPAEATPVMSIAYGSASKRQLGDLANLTAGRVIDGNRSLARALRDAKGYN
jgi:Ca-activated chloride channel family protein